MDLKEEVLQAFGLLGHEFSDVLDNPLEMIKACEMHVKNEVITVITNKGKLDYEKFVKLVQDNDIVRRKIPSDDEFIKSSKELFNCTRAIGQIFDIVQSVTLKDLDDTWRFFSPTNWSYRTTSVFVVSHDANRVIDRDRARVPVKIDGSVVSLDPIYVSKHDGQFQSMSPLMMSMSDWTEFLGTVELTNMVSRIEELELRLEALREVWSYNRRYKTAVIQCKLLRTCVAHVHGQ